MKNNICILTAMFIACVLLATTGCGMKISKYESVIVDAANDGIGVKMDYDIWTGEYFNKIGLSETSVEVFGIQYTGTYQKSIIEKLNSYTTNIYEDDNGIEFGIKDGTSKVVYLNLMNKDFFAEEPYYPDVSNSHEYAVKYARDIAQNYIDLSKYELIEDEPITRQKEKDGELYEITYYYLTFAKKIKGMYTSDYISLILTSKGHLASILIGDINAFDKYEQVNFNIQDIDISIEEKTKKAFSKTEYKYIRKEISDQKLAVTPDNQLILYSYIAVCIMEKNDTDSIETEIGVITALN